MQCENDGDPTFEVRNIKEDVVRVMLPFKDQKSVRRQLHNLSKTIGRKYSQSTQALVNRQCVVYHFKCDLCDADYAAYTCRHLHERTDEHKSSVVGEDMVEQHGEDANIEKNFKVLRKCPKNMNVYSMKCYSSKRLNQV